MPSPDPWLTRRLAARAGLEDAEDRIHAAVTRAMTRFLDEARRLVLGQAPTITAAAGDGTPPNPDAWPHDTVWEQLLRDLVMPVLSVIWGEQFRQLAASADISDQPYREQYLRTVFDRLVIWPVGAFEEIRPELLEALESSETVAQMRDRIGRVLNIDAVSRQLQARINEVEKRLDEPDVPADERVELRAERAELYDEMHDDQGRWRWKAARIARTEVMGAYNGGNTAGAVAWQEDSGEQLFKQWLATSDERTRLSHQVADGQVVPLTEPFIVGGFPLDHPGAAGGPAHEVIQCRCTPLFLDADEGPDAAEAYRVKLAKLEPEEAALAQLVASADTKERTMPQNSTAPGALPYGWKGPMAPMGRKTGDGRVLGVVSTLHTREWPMVFETQKELQPGHMGAVVAGDIQKVWVTEDKMIHGCGRWDLGGVDGAEAARLLAEGFARWVSVDPDAVEFEARWFSKSTGKEVDAPDIDTIWASEEARMLGGDDPLEDLEVLNVMTDYRLVGATHVAQPAYAEAVIEPVWTQQELEDLIADEKATATTVPISTAPMSAAPLEMVAGAGPLAPPVDWFAQAELAKGTALTVTDDGRVFGYVADWDQEHTNPQFAGRRAPASPSGYAYFHTGAVKCEDGTQLACGRISLGGGHAPLNGDVRGATEHYDKTSTAVAIVRAYDDENGIAVFGALCPDVTEEKVAELRRSPLSGDWRVVGGQVEMVAALAVNTAGFPLPRYSMTASGEVLAMVAAGCLPSRPEKPAPVPEPGLTRIAELTAAAVVRELANQESRRNRMSQLASVHDPRTPGERMAELAAAMDGTMAAAGS